MTVDYRVGDSRAVVAGTADGTVDLIASSPPFLALRSYLPAGHESKGDEIGSEANPSAFLDTLLGLTAEWGRVLAPHGSLAIELGDTFAGSGGAGGDYNDGGLRTGQAAYDGSSARGRSLVPNGDPSWRQGPNTHQGGGNKSGGGTGWPLRKSLALIPQLYAIALAYGLNPLTGQASPAGRWRVRNVIVWHRPNPAVGALGDKFRPSTSYIVVATRSAKRWFDLTAVRADGPNPNTHDRTAKGKSADRDGNWNTLALTRKVAGVPPLDAWFDEYDGSHDTWTLTTQPSSLAHYAMWPAKLAERLILSMCPLEVCQVCGEPRRRVERTLYVEVPNRELRGDAERTYGSIDGKRHNDHRSTSQDTLGWTRCDCRLRYLDPGETTYRPGLVLDPFAGTGTTLAVADLHGRDAIGIDLDERNRDLYPRRYDEVKRALYGTPPEIPGQMQMAL